MPLGEAEQLFSMALNSKLYEAMLNNRDLMIDSLNSVNSFYVDRFETLLKNSNAAEETRINQLVGKDATIQTYVEQLRYQKKKTLWANIKFYVALAALGVVTYLALDK
jgi:hypothetical protein